MLQHCFYFSLMVGVGIAVKKADCNRCNFFCLSKFFKTFPYRIDINGSHDCPVITYTLLHV